MPRSLPPRLPPPPPRPTTNASGAGRPSARALTACARVPSARHAARAPTAGAHGSVKTAAEPGFAFTAESSITAQTAAARPCASTGGRNTHAANAAARRSVHTAASGRSAWIAAGLGYASTESTAAIAKRGAKLRTAAAVAAFASTGSRGTSVWTAVVKESVRTASSDATATNAGEADGVRTVA